MDNVRPVVVKGSSSISNKGHGARNTVLISYKLLRICSKTSANQPSPVQGCTRLYKVTDTTGRYLPLQSFTAWCLLVHTVQPSQSSLYSASQTIQPRQCCQLYYSSSILENKKSLSHHYLISEIQSVITVPPLLTILCARLGWVWPPSSASSAMGGGHCHRVRLRLGIATLAIVVG